MEGIEEILKIRKLLTQREGIRNIREASYIHFIHIYLYRLLKEFWVTPCKTDLENLMILYSIQYKAVKNASVHTRR